MKVFILISLFLLVSCGGGGSSPATSNNSDQYPIPELRLFTVQGTSTAIDDVIQLNSVESNRFSVSVNIRALDTGRLKGYDLKLFLSEDAKYDPQDQSVFDGHCSGKQCVGYIDYLIKCSFEFRSTNSMKMQFFCDGNGDNGLADIDERFLNTLPKRAHLLLVLYDFTASDYKVYSKKVEIN